MNATPVSLTPEIASRRAPISARDAGLLALLGLGISLRAFQYFSGPDQWLDEIALSKAVIELDMAALWLGPLPYDQVAPPGFLVLQKFLIGLLGPQDYVFRLLPFFSSIASMAVFCGIARRHLEGAATFTAVLLLATAGPVIMFGGLHKQYASDLFAAVLMLFLALRALGSRCDRQETILQIASGVTLVCLSHAAAFMTTAILPSVLTAARDSAAANAARLRSRIAIAGSWSLPVVILYVLRSGSAQPASRAKLDAYWAAGYPPWDPAQVPGWLLEQLSVLLGRGGEQASLAYPVPILFLMLGSLGFASLVYRRATVAAVIALPILATLAAAALRLYPFHDRTILFLLPSMFLCVAAAADAIAHFTRSTGICSLATGRFVTSSLIGIISILPLIRTPPPYHMGQIGRVLDYVAENRQPGDRVYAYYGAGPAVQYYGARKGFRDSDIIIGGCHRSDLIGYEEELRGLLGNERVWVIITHALAQYRSREGILAYLDRVGTRRDHYVIPSAMVAGAPSPAEAFLYDLSSTPPSGASVESPAPTTAPRAFSRAGCDFGPFRMLK